MYSHPGRDQASISGLHICSSHAPRLFWWLCLSGTLPNEDTRKWVVFDMDPDNCHFRKCTHESWILSWLPWFPSPESPLPFVTPLLPSSYPTLWLPVLPPLPIHPPNWCCFPLTSTPPLTDPHFWLTVFLLPWTFSAFSRCVIIPLSLPAPSSYQSTSSLFLFYHSSDFHSILSFQTLQPLLVVVLGPVVRSHPWCN